MENYPKEIILRQKESVLIRKFTEDDMDALVDFFQNLPVEDRMYLRSDVMERDNLEKRFGNVNNYMMYMLIALSGETIVGQCNLSRAEFGWKRNLGELRISVARDFQRKGLCTALTREIFLYAMSTDLYKIQAEIMEEQKSAVAAMERMGFKKEAVLKKHVTDINNQRNNLMIMSLDIQDTWYLLEDQMSDPMYVT